MGAFETSGQQGRSSKFPAFVTLLFLVLLVAYRIKLGAGFGFSHQPTAGYVPTGFVGDIRDNYSYTSWAQQATAGPVRFSDVYTTQPHDQIYLNPYFLLIGRIAAALHIQPSALINLMGLVGAALAVFCSDHIARAVGLSEKAARWVTVCFPFVLGASSLVAAICTFRKIPPNYYLGGDVKYHDVFGLSCFITTPYQSLTWGLVCVIILIVLNCLQTDLAENRLRRRLILLTVATFLVATIRPYEPVILLVTYGLFFILSLFRKSDRQDWRRLARPGIALAIAAAPMAIYSAWVSKHTVWDEFAQQSLALYRGRRFWIVAYGLTIPLALLGIFHAFKSPHARAARWLASWVLFVFTMLIVVDTPSTKIAACGALPVWIMTVAAVFQNTPRAPWQKWLLCGTFALTVFIGVATSVAFVKERLKSFSPAVYGNSPDLIAAANFIAQQSPQILPSVLTDGETGAALPAIAPVRVYIGHETLTPSYNEKARQMAQAGFPIPYAQTRPTQPASPEAFNTLLQSAHCDYALINTQTQANTLAQSHPKFKQLSTFNQWIVYKIQP